MDATISIFWRPSRHAKDRMLPWPPLNSSSLPGRRDWTGAMPAGWPMGRRSIQSPYQGRVVGAQTCPLGCVATGNGIVFFTALTPSALQLLLMVSVWLLTLVFYSANVHKKVCKTLSVTFVHGATLSPAHCVSLLSVTIGTVYFLHTNKLNFTEAVQACIKDGGQIAKVGQLYAAWRLMGLDRCDAGWLADRSVRYPIVKARTNCGPSEPGIRNFGFLPEDHKYNVYCYR